MKRASRNLLFGTVTAKYGLKSEVLAVQAPSQSSRVEQAGKKPLRGTRGDDNDDAVEKLTTKVKLSQVVNQAIEQEMPLLTDDVLVKHRKKYVEVCGGEPFSVSRCQ